MLLFPAVVWEFFMENMPSDGRKSPHEVPELDALPELQPDATFRFACNETVPCFNRCCAELTLPLTPYDVLRLRRHLDNIDSASFFSTYVTVETYPEIGFPLPLLKMIDGPGAPCPFVTPGGCAIYEDRPGACRAFPLGRGSRIGENGQVVERFFLVSESHCRGFDEGPSWTAHTWMASQGLDAYNAANDRYMRLLAMVKASGSPVSPRMASMCLLCLYQLDKFRELLVKMQVADKVVISAERWKAIMAVDEDCLDFALDWIELVLFGQCPGLQRKS